MKLAWTEFEKRLRGLLRAELARAPALLKEYKARRKRATGPATRLANRLVMPLFWGVLFASISLKQNNPPLALGVISLWAAGLAFGWGQHWFQQFYASEDLVVLHGLPLSDAQIFQFQLRRYGAGALWIAWELLLAYGIVAVVQWNSPEPQDPLLQPPLPLLALGLAALAQAALVMAAALHAANYLHALPLGLIAGLLKMGAVLLLISGQYAEVSRAAVRATEWFLPTGWIHYMLRNFQSDYAILLLLVPLGAIVFMARRSFARLRGAYSLADLEIVPGTPGGPAPGDEELTSESFHQKPGPTEIEDRIAARHFLSGVNWEHGGWVERWVARMLSAREKVVAEFLVAQDPHWSRSLKWSFSIWALSCLAVLAAGQFSETMVFLAAYAVAASCLPLLGGDWRGMRQSASAALLVPGYALYPISFNEMARIFLKVNLARIVAAAPFVVSFAALAAYRTNHEPLAGALIGAKILAALMCLQPLLVILPISATTNDSTSRWSVRMLLLVLPVALTVIAGLVAVIAFNDWLAVAGGYAGLLAAAAVFFFAYRRAYRRGKFDLLKRRAAD